MKKLSILLTLFFISFTGFGQNSKIDSLYHVLNSTKSDTARISVLMDISKEVIYQDTDRYKELADSIMMLAKSSKSKYYIGMANLVWGRYYFATAENENAIRYYKNAATYFINTPNENKLNIVYGNIGSAFMNSEELDSAEFYLKKALKISTKQNDLNSLFFNNYNLGVLNSRTNHHNECLKYIIAALKYANQLKNEFYQANCYSIMGSTFLELKEYAKAEQYTKSALNLFRKLNNDMLTGNEYNNLGKLVSETKSDFHGAINYYKEAVKYHLKTSNYYTLSLSLSNIGRNFISLNELDSAEYYLKKSLENADSIEYDEEIIRIYQNLAEISLDKNELIKAKTFGLKSLEIARNSDFLENTSDALFLLADIYAKTNDYKNAYSSYVEASELKDSISSVEKVASVLELSDE